MSRLVFDIPALSERLGAAPFARGERYFTEGRVEIIDVEGETVTAHVEGAQIYCVRLSGATAQADCTCPAFEDLGLCKHVAAVALRFNALDAGETQRARGRIARLRDGLALDSKDALVARIIDLAKQHPAVLRALDPQD